jgi:hypothetical protein
MAKSALLMFSSVLVLSVTAAPAGAGPLVDKIVFGDSASEVGHGFQPGRSELITGALGTAARRLPPREPGAWRSDDVSFRLKVDPKTQNYATLRLWGGDVNPNKLVLLCEGRQIGYRHLGDVEILDLGADAPTYSGRFTYKTFPLPKTLTSGKAELGCAIRALGPFAVYNREFSKFQKPMDQASRPLYALYVHNHAYLDAGEADGPIPGEAATRPGPGPEVMEALKGRINREIDKLLSSSRPLTQDEIHFLGRAYDRDWTRAYRAAGVATKVIEGGDGLYAKYLADPRSVTQAPDGGATWIALGPFGETLKILKAEIAPHLDATISGRDGRPIPRREAYAEMLAYGRDFLLENRRLYTNQSMIVDLQGIYYSNDGLMALNSRLALPEPSVRHFLYESAGLEPWSGSRDDAGKPTYSSSAKDTGAFRLPEDYLSFTPAGLSKELGYVGGYGEVQDLVASMYLATASGPGASGDPRLMAQLVKMARARLKFRYPITDADGYRSMALEQTIGWRDPKAPGVTTYVQRMGWDNTPLFIAMVSKDPELMAAGQQMLADNQYYAVIQERLENKGQRVTFGMLDAYDEWRAAKTWPKAATRLPMSAGEPDFVFADPLNATIALKHGEERLYAELYWRANCGVNRLSRIHYMTPKTERVATIYGRVEFTPSGKSCVRGQSPQFSAGAIPDIRYPDDAPAALEGEALPIAKMPQGARFEGARDNPFAGRGDYYETTYGPYLLAINASPDKTFDLVLPTDQGVLTDLVTRSVVAPGLTKMVIRPGQTAVIHMSGSPR